MRPMSACDRGATLLEVLIALAIAGMLAAGAATFTPLRSSALAEATGIVASALREGRAEAARTGAPATVAFDMAGGSLQPARGVPRQLPSGVDLRLETAREAASALGAPAIRFFPEGGATGGRVTLSTPQARSVVEVRWLTGAVRVE